MRYLLAIASLFIVFTSCNKSLEQSATREDELRDGKWKMVAGTQKWDPALGKDTTVYYYDSLPTCKKDDYLVFGPIQDGQQYAGEKCDLSEADAVDFKWYLEDNGKKINFYNAFQTFLHREAVTATFIAYGPSEFTIRYMELPANPEAPTKRDTVTHTYTFRKQ